MRSLHSGEFSEIEDDADPTCDARSEKGVGILPGTEAPFILDIHLKEENEMKMKRFLFLMALCLALPVSATAQMEFPVEATKDGRHTEPDRKEKVREWTKNARHNALSVVPCTRASKASCVIKVIFGVLSCSAALIIKRIACS